MHLCHMLDVARSDQAEFLEVNVTAFDQYEHDLKLRAYGIWGRLER